MTMEHFIFVMHCTYHGISRFRITGLFILGVIFWLQ